MELEQADITLIVNGVLIQDDSHRINAILQKMKAIMADGQLLDQAMQDLLGAINGFVTDIEALLAQPQPNVTAAVEAAHAMQATVEAEAQRVRDAVAAP